VPSWLPAAFADEIVAASSTAVPAPWGNVHTSTRRHVKPWQGAATEHPHAQQGSLLERLDPHRRWDSKALPSGGHTFHVGSYKNGNSCNWQLLAILVTKIMSLAPGYSSTLGYEFYFERPVTKSWDNDLLLHILLDSCSNQCQNDAVKLPSQAWAKRFGTSIQLVVGLARSQRRMIFWVRPFLSLKSLQVNCPHPFFCGSFAQTVSRSADICLRQDPENLWLLDFCLGAKNQPAELIRTAERPRARRHACKGEHIIEILKYWHRPHHATLRSARAFCREGKCVSNEILRLLLVRRFCGLQKYSNWRPWARKNEKAVVHDPMRRRLCFCIYRSCQSAHRTHQICHSGLTCRSYLTHQARQLHGQRGHTGLRYFDHRPLHHCIASLFILCSSVHYPLKDGLEFNERRASRSEICVVWGSRNPAQHWNVDPSRGCCAGNCLGVRQDADVYAGWNMKAVWIQ
jgi:hypothetical protein